MAKVGDVRDQTGQQPLEQPAHLNHFLQAGIGLGRPAQGIRGQASRIGQPLGYQVRYPVMAVLANVLMFRRTRLLS